MAAKYIYRGYRFSGRLPLKIPMEYFNEWKELVDDAIEQGIPLSELARERLFVKKKNPIKPLRYIA